DITVDFSGNTAKITGVVSGDKIDYKTDGLHNRVLIDNAGNDDANLNAAFDIGGFSLISSTTVPNPFQALAFQDDGPSVTVAATNESAVLLTTQDAQTDGDPTDTDTDVTTADFSSVFSKTPAYGADGAGTTVMSYALSLYGADGDASGMSSGGASIKLYSVSGVIVGSTAASAADITAGNTIFSIGVAASTGVVTLTQYAAIDHPIASDPTPTATPFDDQLATLAANLVKLTGTAVTTDFDGDTATDNKVVDLGGNVRFADDGPSAGIALGTSEVIVDETAGNQDDDVAASTTFDKEGDGSPVALSALFAITGAQTDTNLPQYAVSSGAVVASSAGSVGGADGLKSTVFSLAIVGGDGTDSLLDTTDGKDIKLFKEGDLIVGRYDTANGTVDGTDPAAFAIAIDQTGKVAVAQYVSLKHTTPGNGTTPAGSYDERIDLTGLVNGVVTVTDNDDDTASTSTAIGDKINFDDDGPSVGFGNLIGTGTANPQYGYWTRDAGTDGLGAAALDIAVTGFTLVRPDSTTTTGTFSDPLTESLDGSGNYVFTGSLTGDFDNNAGTPNQTVGFTLTAFTNGTYQLDLASGFASSTTTVSTIDGLTAGGPDPVQTLTPGAGLHPPAPLNDKQIVFFNVLATDTESQIESLVGGTPDLTEAQIEGDATLTALLGTEAMNVSTSGIGVGNNNLNGNDTSSSGLDESFVVNPEFDVTKVKVFIDNSVSGYTPATESLYYTIYYTDGTTSGAPVKVLAGDLVAGAKANDPVHFVAQASGGKIIDAVQLTMDSGTIKVPYIEFVTETASLASDVQLAFLATLTDGDSDTATSAFAANLIANELAGSFDFVLTGTSSADAFNIDLPDAKDAYQVNSFTVGADKLVLL
ncbi:MAG: DUF5801 repeats-in-toxin domain-containing protein, partial [Ramlibacter sp.]|nr:DUF5801 repeats-in-toxin domain-containing protein [Ramlibacter sp.]